MLCATLLKCLISIYLEQGSEHLFLLTVGRADYISKTLTPHQHHHLYFSAVFNSISTTVACRERFTDIPFYLTAFELHEI